MFFKVYLIVVPAAGFNESAYLWIHWATEHVPEAVDYMKKYYPKDFTYPQFGAHFKASFYDPNQWLDIFKSSGAKYIVFVSKHHEGYCNWPSKNAFNWNSMDYGPKRDLLGNINFFLSHAHKFVISHSSFRRFICSNKSK